MQQLERFKKANQSYKLKLAIKAGFKDAATYLKFLLKGVVSKVHIVDILDASGSMRGSKYENSKKGILAGLEDIKDCTYTLVEFVQSGEIITHQVMLPVPRTINFFGAKGISTPLYSTVYNTINRIRSLVNKNDKVLIKVYTDGGENGRTVVTPKMCADLISEVEKEGFTVTFVATKEDMKRIIEDLRLDRSNTLEVDNTGFGFMKAFEESRAATISYMGSLSRGENVTKGFYKKMGNI